MIRMTDKLRGMPIPEECNEINMNTLWNQNQQQEQQIKQLDEKHNELYQKYKSKLEYIDQQVQAHTQSEERAKRIYG